MRPQGHFGRAAHGRLDGVGVGVDVEEAEQRQLVQVAEAVEEAAAQLQQGAPAEAADADDQRRPQRAGLRLGDGDAQLATPRLAGFVAPHGAEVDRHELVRRRRHLLRGACPPSCRPWSWAGFAVPSMQRRCRAPA